MASLNRESGQARGYKSILSLPNVRPSLTHIGDDSVCAHAGATLPRRNRTEVGRRCSLMQGIMAEKLLVDSSQLSWRRHGCGCERARSFPLVLAMLLPPRRCVSPVSPRLSGSIRVWSCCTSLLSQLHAVARYTNPLYKAAALATAALVVARGDIGIAHQRTLSILDDKW